MSKLPFFTRYQVPPSPAIEFTEPSMTEQHFKDECDINNIVARYEATGVMPSGTTQPLFGDFAEFPTDLLSSQKFFDDAEERFMQLPAAVRKEFNNSPLELLQALQTEGNRQRFIDLGLIERPVQPQETVVANTPPDEGQN